MNENSLYNHDGKRLYLTADEREAFYCAAKNASRDIRTFCHTLHITGCRISEALETTVDRIDLAEQVIIFRTLKKRRNVHYRGVPVSKDYLDSLDMVHGIRELKHYNKNPKLWIWSRTTAWRHVKRIMHEAGIDISQPHATAKGLRHAFGIHAICKDMPLTELQKALGHADLNTTAIYLDAQGQEKRAFYARTWSA